MRPYLLEEAAEVLDALDAEDTLRVREELGDLLFQILLLARMYEEAGAFSVDDVAAGIAHKMVERHPHVFGGAGAAGANPGSNEGWERRKARPGRSRIDGVPLGLPALVRAHRVAEKAAGVGFDWPDLAGVLAKVDEERGELAEALASGDPAKVAHEYGDLLLALANLGRFLGVSGEDALRMANQRFEHRFRGVEAHAAAAGVEPADAGLDQLEAWWQAVKRAEAR
jgi:MazG family protein